MKGWPASSRLPCALLASLLFHAWLLSLTFGGGGSWLPGLGFPWQDRRIEVPDLRVVVVPAQVTAAEPAVAPVADPLQGSVERPVAGGLALVPYVNRAPARTGTAASVMPEASPKADANPRTGAASGESPAQEPLPAARPDDTAPPPIPFPPVIAVAPTDESTWSVPATPMPTPVIAAVPSASSPETPVAALRDAGDAARSDKEAAELAMEAQRQAEKLEAARQDAARVEAARVEAARVEASRFEATRVEAARVEAARVLAAQVDTAGVEAARAEAARVEAARVEAARVEAARVEAARVEAARVEAARVEAARVEAARVEAARIEAARIEAARIEAARIEAARIEAARVEAAQDAAARREAALRAIGRQLDEERARREAATAAPRLPPSASSLRRYRLFGRSDPNAELILYAEAWSRKIQLNLTFDMIREAAKQPHTDPLVTVAIRSDGSVESVTFVLSSGVAAIDDAIRRVVDSQKPYQPFPPSLAREFDVIEIRRTWYFDTAIRLQ